MKIRTYAPFAGTLGLAAVVALAASGCTTGSPAQPSTAGSGTGTSIIAPAGFSPANAAAVAFNAQPVKLTVTNAVSTTGAPLTYTFEVAYDAGFSSKVQTKDSVAAGSNGQTTAALDALLPGNKYYWHARAQGAGTTGVFGPTFSFTMGAQVTLAAPAAVSPLTGAFWGTTAALTVTNAAKSGPVGPITYKFDVADSAAFTNLVATGTVGEGAGKTAYTPAGLATGRVYYWRATAADAANAVTSAPSATQSFTSIVPTLQAQFAAQEGIVIWPGVQPTGTYGHVTFGDGWAVQNRTSHEGVRYVSPALDELRMIDLLDLGYDVPSAIAWQRANGYPTSAAYYVVGTPPTPVVGFAYDYFSLDYGYWNITFRVE
jgi:hypothetical protein